MRKSSGFIHSTVGALWSRRFLGYATFYLVRNNLSTVAKEMEDALHYDKVDAWRHSCDNGH